MTTSFSESISPFQRNLESNEAVGPTKSVRLTEAAASEHSGPITPEASHHARIEREKTRQDLEALDNEPHVAAKEDHEGKTLLQRSVFDWIEEAPGDVKLHQTITAEEVAEKHGIPERFLLRYLKSEITEAEACQTLPFTLLLVISFSVMAIAHDDAAAVRSIEDSLEADIYDNANFAFTGDYVGHKTMDDVNSPADFWSWLRLGMVPLLFQQETWVSEGYIGGPNATDRNVSAADRGFWLHYNRIVGGLRMVQERDIPDPNPLMGRLDRTMADIPGGPDLLERFVPKDVPCNTREMLKDLYNSPCVGGIDYDIEPEMGLPNERAKHTVDPQREEWLYIFKDTDDILEQLTKLELSSWLDRQTKKIEIAIATYNGEFGVHTLTRVNFYFSRGGHIWKLIIPSSQFADWHDRWYYGVYDGIWLFCITYISIVEIIEIRQVVLVNGAAGIFKQYLSPWNLADWLAVVGGIAIVVVFVASISMRTELNDVLSRIGNMDSTLWDSEDYKDDLDSYYQLLEQNCNYVRYLRLALAVYPCFIIVRLFKSFAAQPKLALVTRTLSQATPDMLHFAIVFFSVFITFAICGIILFGKELRAFTTAPRAILSCFRVMLGDISWEELSAIGRVEATVWLWSFIMTISLLMLNMILAIVMDNYEAVKADTGYAETLLEEAQQWYKRTMGVRRGTYVPLETVLDAVNSQVRRREMRLGRSGSMSKFLSSFLTSDSRSTINKARRDSKDDISSRSLGISESQPSVNIHGEKVDSRGDIIITAWDLVQSVRSYKPQVKMHKEQAVEVIVGAVSDFYERHKQGAELDEVLQLVQKVNYRTKKLVKLARRLHDIRDFGPVEELKWFGMEVEQFVAEVKAEREKELEDVEELKRVKLELSERLLCFDPNDVFPSENNKKGIFRDKTAMLPAAIQEINIDTGEPSIPSSSLYSESITDLSYVSQISHDLKEEETWI